MSVDTVNAVPNQSLDPKISEIIDSTLDVTKPEPPNDYEQLLQVVVEALKFFPPLYIQSVFGPVRNWLPPHRADSEYTILDPWRPVRSLDYLVDLSVPAQSHAPGPWARTLLPPVIQNIFWRPSNYFQQADPYDNVTSFDREHWFFINGVATNEAVAEINSNLISQLFQRPVTVIHNETNSLLLDLLQCAVGKEFKTNPSLDKPQSMTEPAIKATIAILEALKDPQRDKVVVLCHSQGTIIAANVLRALQQCLCHIKTLREFPDGKSELALELIDELALSILCNEKVLAMTEDEVDDYLISAVKKLEVYTFANCADKMTYITHTTNEQGERIGLPYIENFANQFDLVARLGVLSPLRKTEPSVIRIDGATYEKQGLDAWGHLLNQHYLFGMEAFLNGQGRVSNPYQPVLKDTPPQQGNGETPPASSLPRLYQYHCGGRPAPYYE